MANQPNWNSTLARMGGPGRWFVSAIMVICAYGVLDFLLEILLLNRDQFPPDWQEALTAIPLGHVFAASLAKGEMHPLAAPFSIDRFHSGALIDEHGAAGVAH